MAITGIQLSITLSGHTVNRCPECVVRSSRRAVLTQASIAVPDPAGELERSLATGQPLNISFGYRGQAPGAFSGTVARWEPSPSARDQVMIHAVGPEKPLLTTAMTESWFEEPAPALAKRILAASGLAVGALDLPEEIIPRMTMNGASLQGGIMSLMDSLQKGFAHDLSQHYLRLENGNLVLNQEAVAGDQPIIETGAGIIRHKARKNRLSGLETHMRPQMRAGMMFTLKDTRKGISGSFMADAVAHVMRPRSVRSLFSYGGSYDRFQC